MLYINGYILDTLLVYRWASAVTVPIRLCSSYLPTVLFGMSGYQYGHIIIKNGLDGAKNRNICNKTMQCLHFDMVLS